MMQLIFAFIPPLILMVQASAVPYNISPIE